MWVFVSRFGLRSGSRTRAWRWRSARYILAAEAKRPTDAPMRKKRRTRAQPGENLPKRPAVPLQSPDRTNNPNASGQMSNHLLGVAAWAKGLMRVILRPIFGRSDSRKP